MRYVLIILFLTPLISLAFDDETLRKVEKLEKLLGYKRQAQLAKLLLVPLQIVSLTEYLLFSQTCSFLVLHYFHPRERNSGFLFTFDFSAGSILSAQCTSPCRCGKCPAVEATPSH